MYSIYVLVCPRSKRVKYVGITAKSNPRRRFTEHIRDAKLGRDTRNCEWIRSLLAQGMRPVFRIVESTQDSKREVYWINKYKKWHKLNNALVGVVGVNVTEEMRYQ